MMYYPILHHTFFGWRRVPLLTESDEKVAPFGDLFGLFFHRASLHSLRPCLPLLCHLSLICSLASSPSFRVGDQRPLHLLLRLELLLRPNRRHCDGINVENDFLGDALARLVILRGERTPGADDLGKISWWCLRPQRLFWRLMFNRRSELWLAGAVGPLQDGKLARPLGVPAVALLRDVAPFVSPERPGRDNEWSQQIPSGSCRH